MPLLKTKLYTIDDIYALPDGKRAELLDGRIYDMAPPSPLHQELVAVLTTSLQNYIAKKHGNCKVYPAPFAVFIKEDDSNYVEPDISLVCDHNKISNRGCEGAPDFIIEIVSPSSRKMDYSTKNALYADAGVREYWIVDPARERTTIYRYEEDVEPVIIPFGDTIKLKVYEDFQICISDLLKQVLKGKVYYRIWMMHTRENGNKLQEYFSEI